MDPKGAEQVHNVMNAVLELAYMLEEIGWNPTALVKPPTCPRKETFVPTKAQVQALMFEA